MRPERTDRQLRVAIRTWLFVAEREYRLAVATVRDGTDESRRRYAAARRDLDLANRACMQLLTWPTALGASA